MEGCLINFPFLEENGSINEQSLSQRIEMTKRYDTLRLVSPMSITGIISSGLHNSVINFR